MPVYLLEGAFVVSLHALLPSPSALAALAIHAEL
jgi:hypothetical protein